MISIIFQAYVHFLTVTATLKRLFLLISITLISTGVPVNTGSVCSSLFLTCILQNGLTQNINLPTSGNNCIDLVMVSDAVMMLDMFRLLIPLLSLAITHLILSFLS